MNIELTPSSLLGRMGYWIETLVSNTPENTHTPILKAVSLVRDYANVLGQVEECYKKFPEEKERMDSKLEDAFRGIVVRLGEVRRMSQCKSIKSPVESALIAVIKVHARNSSNQDIFELVMEIAKDVKTTLEESLLDSILVNPSTSSTALVVARGIIEREIVSLSRMERKLANTHESSLVWWCQLA